MVDALEEAGIRAFGPNKAAAVIEQQVLCQGTHEKHNIPTADYEVFDNSRDAINYLKDKKYPIVVKADGLALGKGNNCKL